jgi:hypothetical protein
LETPRPRLSSLPLNLAPEQCLFSCLSISNRSLRERRQFGASSKQNYRRSKIIHLMSRKANYRQHSMSLISFSILRNLISTFGYILEQQLQRKIYKIIDLKNDFSTKLDEKVIHSFTSLSLDRSGSLVKPESARANFSVVLPMDHQNGLSHDRVLSRVIFQAEITVNILPNHSKYTASVKIPGTILGIFQNRTNRFETVDIDIDTTALYVSLRKESEKISQKVVNAIAGFDLMNLISNHFVQHGKLVHYSTQRQLLYKDDSSSSRSSNMNELDATIIRSLPSSISKSDKQSTVQALKNFTPMKTKKNRVSLDSLDNNNGIILFSPEKSYRLGSAKNDSIVVESEDLQQKENKRYSVGMQLI